MRPENMLTPPQFQAAENLRGLMKKPSVQAFLEFFMDFCEAIVAADRGNSLQQIVVKNHHNHNSMNSFLLGMRVPANPETMTNLRIMCTWVYPILMEKKKVPYMAYLVRKKPSVQSMLTCSKKEPPMNYAVMHKCTRCSHSDQVTVKLLEGDEPQNISCGHSTFKFDPARGTHGIYVCNDCDLEIPARSLISANEHAENGYDNQRNKLADQLTVLRDEKRALLVENAELRRHIEKLERKK